MCVSNTARDFSDGGVQGIHVIVCIEEAGSRRGIIDTRRRRQCVVVGFLEGFSFQGYTQQLRC